MIENRHRLEKEILLGRQAVRKHQSRGRGTDPDIVHQDSIPETSSNTRRPRISLSPAPQGSDVPLSVDTDAETAYANSARFTRGALVDTPSASTPHDSDNAPSRDILRSPLTRRKWASNLLEPSDADGSGDGVYTPTASTARQFTQPGSPSGFFTRFRTQSFPALTSPFSTFGRSKRVGRENSKGSVTGQAWSSDSSSEEDLSMEDQRHAQHPSTISFSMPLEQTDSGDGGGS